MQRARRQRADASLATRDGTQFPSDWLRDGSALLVTEDGGRQQARHPRAAGRRIDAAGVCGDRRGRDRRAHLARRAVGRVHLRRVGAGGGVPRLLRAPGTARRRLAQAAACIPCGAATGASCTTGTSGRWWRCGSARHGRCAAGGRRRGRCSSARRIAAASTRCTTCRPTGSGS